MDDDSQIMKDAKDQPEEGGLGRRQFLNGLGKWSVAIVAAVAALREGPDQMETGGSSQSGTSSGLGTARPQRIAKRPKKHTDQGGGPYRVHTNNVGIIKSPQGGQGQIIDKSQ
jgi:hypothetical protein